MVAATDAPDFDQLYLEKDSHHAYVIDTLDDKDGAMAHMEAAGKRETMKDGKVMEAKDGSKVMMKNNAVWKTISEHGTLKPGH